MPLLRFWVLVLVCTHNFGFFGVDLGFGFVFYDIEGVLQTVGKPQQRSYCCCFPDLIMVVWDGMVR